MREHRIFLQGTSEDIPKHLQFDGQVRNRKLTRKDTMLFIEDVWQERQRLRTTEVCTYGVAYYFAILIVWHLYAFVLD